MGSNISHLIVAVISVIASVGCFWWLSKLTALSFLVKVGLTWVIIAGIAILIWLVLFLIVLVVKVYCTLKNIG